MKKLKKYNQKRNFNKTKEPKGIIKKSHKKLIFCVQHHLARKDHYDFRLEDNGVLLSWAVPKGPSYNPKDKRLAIKVEDHPISYHNFEGIIPDGEYGGGTVMLFDKGYYKIVVKNNKLIKFILYGKRFKGMWSLIRFKKNNWLLIKDDDYYTNYIDISNYKTSIKTNRTMKQIKNNTKLIKENNNTINYITITNPNKIIFDEDKITKKDIINYYQKIAKRMMPFLENRIISVIRAPNGYKQEVFFKKHLDNKNDGIGKINLKKKEKRTDYYYILDEIGLISEVQMNSFEFHIWGSLASNINKPNLMVFDFDPDEKLSLFELRNGVKDLKMILDDLGLKSFLKTSGGKGYHVLVPVKNMNWNAFSKTAENIALLMTSKWPDKYTTNMRKIKRKGKIFIDWYRNKKESTFVAPYSLRLRKSAPISMPISWKELDSVKPNEITIKNVSQRLKKKDPWSHFFD